ncbi:MAG: hypothetical protein U9O98_04435 [Asgard group archaeon]|nr:hypothetical protein [Asgard group archaeon]
MTYYQTTNCCYYCEHLRVDNFCLVKNSYIRSEDVWKTHDCKHFSKRKREIIAPTKNKIIINKKKTSILEIIIDENDKE